MQSSSLTGSGSCDILYKVLKEDFPLNILPKTVGPAVRFANRTDDIICTNAAEEGVRNDAYRGKSLDLRLSALLSSGGLLLYKAPFGREAIPTIFYKEVKKWQRLN